MAHILFVYRYYPPEIGVGGVCASEIATRLVKLGHQVTVLTTVPNYPTGIVPPEYRGHLVQKEVIDGVQVVRVWSYITPNKGFFGRILSQFSFGLTAFLLGWKEVDQPDIIIVGSPPLFSAIAGRLFAWVRRRPLVFMIADLWPESAVQLGMLHNRLLIKLSEWLEWTTCQKASFVWAVTEGIQQNLLQRGLPPERVFLLTYGVDIVRFRPMPQAQARAELAHRRVPGDAGYVVLYAGNHGLVYDLTSILDAAEQLQTAPDIHFVLVGNGVKKAELVVEAQRRGLTNVTFLDAVPHERMPLLLAGADVCLVPLRKLPLLEGSLPVKMFEMMACARPFILAAEGEARRLAEQEAGAAMYVEPENAAALASAILYLRAHPEEAAALGRQGRLMAEARFDYDRLAVLLDARLATLLDKHTPVFVH